jgi:hypothetical protein
VQEVELHQRKPCDIRKQESVPVAERDVSLLKPESQHHPISAESRSRGHSRLQYRMPLQDWTTERKLKDALIDNAIGGREEGEGMRKSVARRGDSGKQDHSDTIMSRVYACTRKQVFRRGGCTMDIELVIGKDST